jgi:lipoprotein NlpI
MFRFFLAFIFATSLTAAEAVTEARDADPYESAVIDGREAQRKGLLGKAIESFDKAIKLNDKKVPAYFFKGDTLAMQRKHAEAIALFTKVIELDPKASSAYRLRGDEQLKLGEIEKAVDDFNKYIALEPRGEPNMWQRGIALYYAGKFSEARRQFELHQAVNPHDVENGAWQFLCAAREKGFEKARENMLSISGDRRVPMDEIYELFRGKATVDDVWKATKKGEPLPVEMDERRFYAYLYIGLFHEAKGDAEKAYENIKAAATEFRAEHYMGDIARVHFKRLLAAKAK